MTTKRANPAIARQDRAYLKRGRWKCKKSPTGAHYSIGDGKNPEVFTCLYCGKEMVFEASYDFSVKKLAQLQRAALGRATTMKRRRVNNG